MKYISRFALLALATLCAGSAYANGGYLGLARTTPGETYVDFAAARGVENYNSPVALKFYGGIKLTEQYAIEVGYGAFGTWKVANPAPGSKEEVHLSSRLMYVAGKASMPVGESLAAFAKLGIASNKLSSKGSSIASSSTSAVRPMLGLGASYDVTPHIAATLEFNYYGKAGNFKQQKVELGLQYKF